MTAAVLMLQQDVPTLLENVSVGSILFSIVIFIIAWLLIRWSSRTFDYLSNRSARGRFVLKRVEPMVRMIVWFYATFLALRFLAPSPETFIALLASIGLAIGLGAQDLVKNIIGGIVVLIDRPYQLGDRVRIGDAYGEIDHIGLRSTKLTTPDDTRVTIPNSEVLTGMVFNANSGVPDCQVVTDVIIPHNVNPHQAIHLGYEAAFSSPFLLLDKPVVVLLLDRFDRAPYCILRVKAYVYNHRAEPRMQSDVTARVKSELLTMGVMPSLATARADDRSGPANVHGVIDSRQ